MDGVFYQTIEEELQTAKRNAKDAEDYWDELHGEDTDLSVCAAQLSGSISTIQRALNDLTKLLAVQS